MIKSLGDYNKEKSSSSDTKNIKWTKKNLNESEKPKREKTKKIPPTNIIYSDETTEKQILEKSFKVDEKRYRKKLKNNLPSKKFQKSSVSNSKIKPEFKRPGR